MAWLAIGLGMTVIGYDPYPSKDFNPTGFELTTFEDVISRADVISLHCPPEDEPLLNEAAILTMKAGAYVVNTARAELIDNAAFLKALESGHLSGLATDVFQEEPPALNDLLAHDRVTLTPHAGGFTEESVTRATEIAVANLLKVLEPA